MILIFFGPPGAGKGTQANLISNYLKIPHLSTGDIFRKKLKDKTSLSSELKNDSLDFLVQEQIISNLIKHNTSKNKLSNQKKYSLIK